MSYLETHQHTFIRPADRPPTPELDSLREIGIPTVTDEAFAMVLEALTDRRQTLLGLVRSDTREWPADKKD